MYNAKVCSWVWDGPLITKKSVSWDISPGYMLITPKLPSLELGLEMAVITKCQQVNMLEIGQDVEVMWYSGARLICAAVTAEEIWSRTFLPSHTAAIAYM